MRGMCKIALSVVVIVLATSASARSPARCRMLPGGPGWYLDELGCWHSIRDDWAGIERHVRAWRLQSQSSAYGTDTGAH